MSEKITVQYQDSLNEDQGVPDVTDVSLVTSTDNEESVCLKQNDRQDSDDSLEIFTRTLSTSPEDNNQEISIKVPQINEYKRQESFSSTIVIDVNADSSTKIEDENLKDEDIEEEYNAASLSKRVRDSVEITQLRRNEEAMNHLENHYENDRPISFFTQSINNFDNAVSEFEDYENLPLRKEEEPAHKVHFSNNTLTLNKTEETEDDNHSIDRHVEDMERSIKELDNVFQIEQSKDNQCVQEEEEIEKSKKTEESEKTLKEETNNNNMVTLANSSATFKSKPMESIKEETLERMTSKQEKQQKTDEKKKKVSFIRAICCVGCC